MKALCLYGRLFYPVAIGILIVLWCPSESARKNTPRSIPFFEFSLDFYHYVTKDDISWKFSVVWFSTTLFLSFCMSLKEKYRTNHVKKLPRFYLKKVWGTRLWPKTQRIIEVCESSRRRGYSRYDCECANKKGSRSCSTVLRGKTCSNQIFKLMHCVKC